MKTIIAICLLFSSVSFADKQSDKHQVDRCFKILNSMIDDTNNAQFSGNHTRAVATQNNFNQRKLSCNKIKTQYESLYGKYELPPATTPLKELRELKHEEAVEVICMLRANAIRAKASSPVEGYRALQLLDRASYEYTQTYFRPFSTKCS